MADRYWVDETETLDDTSVGQRAFTYAVTESETQLESFILTEEIVGRGWFAVQDGQIPNWTIINDVQASAWQEINNAQSPDWKNIDDSQS